MNRTTSLIKFAAQLEEQVTRHREIVIDLRVTSITSPVSHGVITTTMVSAKTGLVFEMTLDAGGTWSPLILVGNV